MRTLLVENDRRETWNALAIQEPSFSLMQSWEWGEYKATLGWRVFRVAVEQDGTLVAGAQVLLKSAPLRMGSVAYIPRGPFGQWMNPGVFNALIDRIDSIAKSCHAVFLKMEPAAGPNEQAERLYSQHSFRRSHHSTQPLTTIIMDIAEGEQALLCAMRKSTRRKILSAERKEVMVRPGGVEDLDLFYRMMQVTASRAGFEPKPLDYYAAEWEAFDRCGRAGFFLAYYNNTPLAAHIAYTFGPHAAFFHQVSSGEYAHLNANCLLVWEEIKWAKARGCRSYDLWGIPDEVDESSCAEGASGKAERTDGLWGVYKFKRGFCKNIVRFCGSYDRVYRPLLYNTMMTECVYDGLEKVMVCLDRNHPTHAHAGSPCA
jgi:lipid II:glycine glycyltransferase (peptidoglycan interpeptide bridge formation enzyme)